MYRIRPLFNSNDLLCQLVYTWDIAKNIKCTMKSKYFYRKLHLLCTCKSLKEKRKRRLNDNPLIMSEHWKNANLTLCYLSINTA